MAADSKSGRGAAHAVAVRDEDGRRDSDLPVAIVTRAAGSIESAVVRRLARIGMSLVVCDGPEAAGLSDLEAVSGPAGTSVTAVPADVTSESDVRRVVDRTHSTFGRIDVLVNGLVPSDGRPLSEQSFQTLADDIAAGTRSPLLFIRAVVPHMVAGGGGRIVNITSSVGRYRSAYFRPEREGASYLRESGTDGALLALTRELALELAPRSIRVNAATVGWIRAAAADRAWHALSERERAFLLEEISLRRLGEPDEAAAVVEFLASDASSYVTGTAVDVNGGWWMS